MDNLIVENGNVVNLPPLRECIICQLPVPADEDENTPYCSNICLHVDVDRALLADKIREKIQKRIVHRADCMCHYE